MTWGRARNSKCHFIDEQHRKSEEVRKNLTQHVIEDSIL